MYTTRTPNRREHARRRTLRRVLALLMTAAVTLGLAQGATAAPSRSAVSSEHVTVTVTSSGMSTKGFFCNEASRYWPNVYLLTGYGPVVRYTQIAGRVGRVGFYSPITKIFKPESPWMDVYKATWYNGMVRDGQGKSYPTVAYGTFKTLYGPVAWAAQFTFAEARWGTWSFEDNKFHPSTAWMPQVTGRCP